MLPLEHSNRIQIAFDDHRLVANAGLLLPVTLRRIAKRLEFHGGGLCPSDALAGGRSLPGDSGGAGGHGQTPVSSTGQALKHAPSRRPCTRRSRRQEGPADCQAAGVPLHPQARKLVEHGGNRVQRTIPLLPEAATPRRGGAPAGKSRLWLRKRKRRPSHHPMEVQHPGRPDQTSPPLPF